MKIETNITEVSVDLTDLADRPYLLFNVEVLIDGEVVSESEHGFIYDSVRDLEENPRHTVRYSTHCGERVATHWAYVDSREELMQKRDEIYEKECKYRASL